MEVKPSRHRALIQKASRSDHRKPTEHPHDLSAHFCIKDKKDKDTKKIKRTT